MYQDNPLFHRQLKTAYRVFRRRGVHLGVTDKLLFKQFVLRQRGYDFALVTLASVADTQGWENIQEGLRLYRKILEQEGE